MTVQDASYYVLKQLRAIYDEGEASQVTDWIMEKITGSKKTERMLYKNSILTNDEEIQLRSCTGRLMQHEPIQYVLNESWFCGLKFYVDKTVLIPRPETEELVEWIISNCKFPVDELKILDIGSGSGCIPISLKRRLKKAEVWSCDINKEALAVAQKNAAALGTDVNFILLDFLNTAEQAKLPKFDIVVSNPPYVPEKDKDSMKPNVLQYEPAAALFVPDKDPLVFYRAISEFGKEHLNTAGSIYCEIHEATGEEVVRLFNSYGFTTELKKDMQQKDRMVKVVRS